MGMRQNRTELSRRQLLRTAGAGAATVGFSGLASASPDDTVEVNVGFRSSTGKQAAHSTANTVVRTFAFDAVTLRLPKRAATTLQKNPEIRYVEENGWMHAIAQSLPWGVDRIDSDVAHQNGETGNGADIAIIDTGIDSDHPDLQANLGAGKAFVECGTGGYFGCLFFGNNNTCHEPWDDDNNHGTHCGGIADAINNNRDVVGVSTNATLHAVKVLDCSGRGSFSDVAKGIEYTADQGWDVGSMSLGGSASNVVKDAVEYAYDRGVLLVAAAGNSGPCSNCVSSPAAYPECIAVSATTRNDDVANFSSTGPQIELAAPGKSIRSTVPGGTATYSGTSMACPHVSGSAAQLMANGYTHTEARDRLNTTAETIGLSANETGNGLVDVAAALGFDSGDNL